MHSAVGAEAEEVELLAGLLHVVVGGLDFRVGEEFVLAACDVDLDEVLVDNAAGAEVHVTDLGVAHLAVGQADVFAACLEVAEGIFLAQAVDERLALGVDCIAMVVASFAPTIKDHKKYFSIHYIVYLCFAAAKIQIIDC